MQGFIDLFKIVEGGQGRVCGHRHILGPSILDDVFREDGDCGMREVDQGLWRVLVLTFRSGLEEVHLLFVIIIINKYSKLNKGDE